LAAYVATYIERDVRNILRVGDLVTFQRFVELCAGRTAQMLNLSTLAGDAGISQPTAKAWLSILETTFIVFRLPPFRRNVRKRLTKLPKLHFYDTGLACWLLGIRTVEQLRGHPLRGPIFETWVASEIVKHRVHRGETRGVCFYRDHNGSEADLTLANGDTLSIVEVKAGATVSADMVGAPRKVAAILKTAASTRVFVVYGGDTPQPRSDVAILPWKEIHKHDWLSG
jgi:hypothetical protein